MRIFKKFLLFIATVLSLVVHLVLFGVIYESMEKDVERCNHKSINNFEVDACFNRGGKEPIELVTYTFNEERVIVLTGIDSFDTNQTLFLKKILKESMGESKEISTIKIIAHSTLMATHNNSEFGKKRASLIKKTMKEIGYKHVNISTSYRKDIFLDKVNFHLNGTLLPVLELQSDIKLLKNKLNISKNYQVDEVRKRFENNSTALDNYREELEPYGSTVVLISFKK